MFGSSSVLDESRRPSLAQELTLKPLMTGAMAGTLGYYVARFPVELPLSRCSTIESLARTNAHNSVLRGAGITALMTGANYTLDSIARKFDENGQRWYSINPTSIGPYRSTIFAPNIVETMAYSVAGGLQLNGKARVGLVAGGWVLGRVANIVVERHWR